MIETSFLYDAIDSWGNATLVSDAAGNEITATDHIGNVNPIRYRGYYYDAERRDSIMYPAGIMILRLEGLSVQMTWNI